MKITLSLDKSLEENADSYFSRSKKIRKKIDGAREALEKTNRDFERERKAVMKIVSQLDLSVESDDAKVSQNVHRYWFEKFRYMITSTGFLCVTASDATSNEILIKKQAVDHDIVIHTELPGSPFTIIKIRPGCDLSDDIRKQTIYEASVSTISYSRLWRQNLSEGETFSVLRSQLSKASREGINVPRGSFVVLGKKQFLSAPLRLAMGIVTTPGLSFHDCADLSFSTSADEIATYLQGRIVSGPEQAIATYCDSYVVLEPGKEKTSDCAKRIQHFIQSHNEIEIPLDDIIRLVPAGGSIISRRKTKE